MLREAVDDVEQSRLFRDGSDQLRALFWQPSDFMLVIIFNSML
jgi:hypothetical protein